MKKLLLLGITAFALTMGVNAQVQRKVDSTQKVMKRAGDKNMMGQLDLTADQRQKMKEINQDQKQKAEAIRNNDALSDAQKKEQLKELNKKRQESVNAILTKEQKEKMSRNADMRKDKVAAMKDRKDLSKANGDRKQMKGHGMEGMKKLNLTPDQQQKVKELNQSQKQKADAIRNDNTLTKDQKASQLKELNKNRQEAMKSILSKDQQEQWKEMKKGNGRKNQGNKQGQVRRRA